MNKPLPRMTLTGLPPVIDQTTRTLILGSFPGIASLQAQQYYAHPRNQFWALLSALLQTDLQGMAYQQRLACLLQHGIGLWDVIAGCRRAGSLDSAIRAARANPFDWLGKNARPCSRCASMARLQASLRRNSPLPAMQP